jgi:hypothetical protein
MTFVYVLDTGAVLRLIGEHNTRIASLLYDASAHGCAAAVPVTCLRAALAAADRVEDEAGGAAVSEAGGTGEWPRVALGAPVLKVIPVPDADRPLMRAAADRVGDPELAHAAVEALTRRCRLLTTRAPEVRALGLADWQIVPV